VQCNPDPRAIPRGASSRPVGASSLYPFFPNHPAAAAALMVRQHQLLAEAERWCAEAESRAARIRADLAALEPVLRDAVAALEQAEADFAELTR